MHPTMALSSVLHASADLSVSIKYVFTYQVSINRQLVHTPPRNY